MEVPVYGSMLDFMKAVSAPSSTSNATQKGWKSAPENADETMIAEGNIMAKAMLDSVHILDVSLIYAAMLAVVSKPVISEPVDDLVMQIRRLVHSLKKHNPDSKLVLQVMDYMKRNGYFKATDCLRANGDEGTNHVD
jgi:alpha-D-ribose 1-methylphosphonate 5-triphosphate synthase subunit PhnI